MLSLKEYEIPTLEVEAPDGEILHVLPASKRLVDKIAAIESGNSEAFGQMIETIADCLSQNRENRTVTAEELENIPIPALVGIFKQYTDFIRQKVDEAKN